jgi:hypothetical protein
MVDYVRKFILVPSEGLSRIGNMPNPHAERSEVYRRGMTTAMDDRNLTEDERKLRYSQRMREYLIHRDRMNRPVKLDVGFEGDHDDPDAVDGDGDQKPMNVLQSALNSFHYGRASAKELGTFLRTVRGLSWNQRGEIAVDGHIVPRSSLTALIRDVISPNPTLDPVGRREFGLVLRRAALPEDMIGDRTGNYRPGGVVANEGALNLRLPVTPFQQPPRDPYQAGPSSSGYHSTVSRADLDQTPAESTTSTHRPLLKRDMENIRKSLQFAQTKSGKYTRSGLVERPAPYDRDLRHDLSDIQEHDDSFDGSFFRRDAARAAQAAREAAATEVRERLPSSSSDEEEDEYADAPNNNNDGQNGNGTSQSSTLVGRMRRRLAKIMRRRGPRRFHPGDQSGTGGYRLHPQNRLTRWTPY